MSDEISPRDARRLFVLRLLLGLFQGLLLLGLYRLRKTLGPMPAVPLWLLFGAVPLIALGAIGRLRRVSLAAWLAGAALLTSGLGAYDVFVRTGASGGAIDFASPQLALFLAVALYILHHLITAADAERRWRGSYDRYFDEAWLDAVRLALAAAFVGALWLLLFLGAALFKLIGVKLVEQLIRNDWFAFPITCVFLAIALHITDVRAQLVRGARTLALTLLSWLLPILAAFVGLFLLTIPFTGLAPLWATRSATATMLAVCAAFVILINAVYQDGERDDFPPMVLRWAVRLAGVLLAPMVLIAAYSLALRIGQYGLSPERIYAAMTVLMAAIYAAGYLWAAVRRGPWMKPLETTNWLAAYVAVAAIVLVFSPLVDPARLSVGDQLKRLETGRTAAKDFDYRFLHFDSGRWGLEALKTLAAGKGPVTAQAVIAAAKDELKAPRYGAPRPSAERLGASLTGAVPPDFANQTWSAGEDPAAGCGEGTFCHAIVGDVDGQAGDEVIVFRYSDAEVYGRRDGRWRRIGTLAGGHCGSDAEAVAKGRFNLLPPEPMPSVVVDGRRMVFAAQPDCPAVELK